MAYILPEASNAAPSTPKILNQIVSYQIPIRYRNAFYLANASLYDSVNWYIHRAYEIIFPTLTQNLKQIRTQKSNAECEEVVNSVIGLLEQCNSITDVRFPIQRQDGKFEMIRGFRAQHGMGSGYLTTLGGFRMGEHITRDHMKGLSCLQTFRNACMGIGMSGAHGGLKINPADYTENELRHIIEEYAIALMNKGYCNGNDIMQPDIKSSSREMTWIAGTLLKYSESGRLTVTGKCLEAGGIDGYQFAASQGAYLALNNILNNEELMKKCSLDRGLTNKTFIIQGLGNVGSLLAEILVEKGAICVGVKEHDAYLYETQGINLKKLYEHRRKTGSIDGYSNAKNETDDSIYKENVDILIFAATHKSLSCYIADDVKAKVILEAADSPLTPSSHKILTGKSRIVIPDIYACSGATIASYLEYLSNLQQMRKLDENILRQSREIYGTALKGSEQAVAFASGSSVSESVITKAVVAETIECVLNDVEKEMLKYTNLFKLGTDIRSSAYIVGINKIFNNILENKKFI